MWDWLRRYTQPDELIDELIRRNSARPVEGMSSADWRTINRVGAERWRERARAQAHAGRRDAHGASAAHVIPLRKAG
jgi:hypothetical protein